MCFCWIDHHMMSSWKLISKKTLSQMLHSRTADLCFDFLCGCSAKSDVDV
jgi:uncharacterized membrane protein